MAARARFLDGWNRREEGAIAGTAFRFRAEWLSWIANMSDVCFLIRGSEDTDLVVEWRQPAYMRAERSRCGWISASEVDAYISDRQSLDA